MVRKAFVGIGSLIAATAILGSAYVFVVNGDGGDTSNCPGGVVGAAIGGPFSLTDQNGETFTDLALAGAPSLMYFGYATCPDVCPTELADVAAAVDIVNEESGVAVRPVFITVDPERDTPERLAEYVPFFHDRMIGLTGTPEEVKSAAKAYRVYYQKAPDEDFPDGYAMDHSSFIYLLDRDGSFITYFKYGDTPEVIAAGTQCHLKIQQPDGLIRISGARPVS